MTKAPRSLPQGLSAAERRVLESFFRGRLPAGGLSAALQEARCVEPRRAPASRQPVPALRYAA